MKLSPELHARIKSYTDHVSANLTRLSPDEQADILGSIESHIFDALSRKTDGEPTMRDLEDVLAEMDHPDTYAALSPETPSVPTSRTSIRHHHTTIAILAVLLLVGALAYRALTAGNPSLLLKLQNASSDFPDPRMYSKTMVADLYHGSLPAELTQAIENEGISIQKSDAPISVDTLRTAGILWVSDAARVSYRRSELKAIQNFVFNGGTLICSDQVWYWTYDKKPAKTHPVNQIGSCFGFTITGQNIGLPTTTEPSEFLSGIEVTKTTDWWPSKIDVSQSRFYPLIRDENMNIMAVHFPYGNGHVFVFGHGSLLRDNPGIVVNITRQR